VPHVNPDGKHVNDRESIFWDRDGFQVFLVEVWWNRRALRLSEVLVRRVRVPAQNCRLATGSVAEEYGPQHSR
jgi:hypothetical protein